MKKVVVIGGGPGGYVCAIRLAQLGAEVVLIEKKELGGTCLNVGCIPTKALLHAAEVYESITGEGPTLGITSEHVTVDWKTVQAQKQRLVKRLVGGVSSLLQANGVTVINGEGRFTDSNTIEVITKGNVQNIAFDAAVIATGAKAKIPPIPGAEDKCVITSTEALALEHIPKSLIVIGGGVIGCEMANIYATFGTKVTILEALPDILMNMEKEPVAVLKKRFSENGIELHTGVRIKEITSTDNGLEVVTEDTNFAGEYVLMATGRAPDFDELALDKAGVSVKNGFIAVNPKTMQTQTPHIYAIGDCNGGIQLAHVASAEGETAAEHLFGNHPEKQLDIVPSGVYTSPELASVGLTEAQAEEKGFQVQTGIFPLAGNGKSMITGDDDGLIKFVTDSITGEILGMHMAGPRATDIIGEGALAMRLECTVDEILTTIHAHPTVAEAVQEAALDVYGRAIHMPPKKA